MKQSSLTDSCREMSVFQSQRISDEPHSNVLLISVAVCCTCSPCKSLVGVRASVVVNGAITHNNGTVVATARTVRGHHVLMNSALIALPVVLESCCLQR